MLVGCAQAIYDAEGELVGVAAADVTLTDLTRLLEVEGLGEDQTGYLVDAGRLLATTDPRFDAQEHAGQDVAQWFPDAVRDAIRSDAEGAWSSYRRGRSTSRAWPSSAGRSSRGCGPETGAEVAPRAHRPRSARLGPGRPCPAGSPVVRMRRRAPWCTKPS